MKKKCEWHGNIYNYFKKKKLKKNEMEKTNIRARGFKIYLVTKYSWVIFGMESIDAKGEKGSGWESIQERVVGGSISN